METRAGSRARQRAVISYLLTFGTYSTRLHGDDRGSWTRKGFQPPNAPLRLHHATIARQEPFRLDGEEQRVVVASVRATCERRDWRLHAVHARPEHVHVVLACDVAPRRAIGDLKAFATRALREAGWVGPLTIVWARGGGANRLAIPEALESAIDYVLFRQGTPTARWPDPPRE